MITLWPHFDPPLSLHLFCFTGSLTVNWALVCWFSNRHIHKHPCWMDKPRHVAVSGLSMLWLKVIVSQNIRQLFPLTLSHFLFLMLSSLFSPSPWPESQPEVLSFLTLEWKLSQRPVSLLNTYTSFLCPSYSSVELSKVFFQDKNSLWEYLNSYLNKTSLEKKKIVVPYNRWTSTEAKFLATLQFNEFGHPRNQELRNLTALLQRRKLTLRMFFACLEPIHSAKQR